MKKLILILLFLFSPFFIYAQTQTGVVKTRGRLADDGSIIPGVGLEGAVVSVQGRNAVVSSKDGSFRVRLTGEEYYIQSVQKEGYEMVDPDFLKRSHSYSREKVYIVMETPTHQLEARLAATNRINRTLNRQIEEKEKELERLKEENRITQEEYRIRLQALCDEEELNHRLVSDMAERYSQIDYDQMDAFNSQVAILILNGDLVKADSLIQTKGSIKARAEAVQIEQDAIAKEEDAIRASLRRLEKQKEYVAMELADVARDCYSKYEICNLRHQVDSAAYYLELRASLDTTNTYWLHDVAVYSMDYLIDYTKAEDYFNKIRLILLQHDETNGLSLSNLYSNIGVLNEKKGDLEKALEYYSLSIELGMELGDIASFYIGTTYNQIGSLYGEHGPYEKGIDYLEKAIELLQPFSQEPDYNIWMASIYNNLGTANKRLGNYEKAIEFYQKSISIRDDYLIPIINIGCVYSEQYEFSLAIPYLEQALELSIKSYGEKHPKTASCYGELGFAQGMSGAFQEGVENILKSIAINKVFYGEITHSLIPEYNNLATLYNEVGDLQYAADYLEKTLEIQLVLDPEDYSLGFIYYNCAILNDKLGNVAKACEYCKKSLAIFDLYVPETHPVREKVRARNELLKQKLSELEE